MYIFVTVLFINVNNFAYLQHTHLQNISFLLKHMKFICAERCCYNEKEILNINILYIAKISRSRHTQIFVLHIK